MARNRTLSSPKTLLDFAEMDLSEDRLIRYTLHMARIQGRGEYNLNGIYNIKNTAREMSRHLIWC
jgi:hypothetical protein